MKKLLIFLFLAVISSGCATSPVYDPLAASAKQTFLLNETSLAQVKVGMTQEQIHKIMGDSLVIGYAYQKPLTEGAEVTKASANDYKPVTINNPYKTEDIKTKDGNYSVEYYVHSIKDFDGVVSDEELIPLIFHDGLLVDRGWNELKALRSKISS